MYKKRVCLDYGHGGLDSGASYKGRLEKKDNIYLGKRLKESLEKEGVLVIETRKNDSYVSLSKRAKIANNHRLDLFISIHRNAFMPEVAEGVEIYRYYRGNRMIIPMAEDMLNNLLKLGFKNRGLKNGSFYLLRATKAPALILELGFIDSSTDNKLFDKNLDNIVEIIKKLILNYIKI